MRLRKRLRSRSLSQLKFQQEWASVFPRHPQNHFIKDYLAQLKRSTWPSVRTAKAKAGTPSPSTTATAPKSPATSGVLSRLKKSVARVLGKGLCLVALTLLTVSCAQKAGPCVTLECGLVCCNNDGEVCEGCDGKGVREHRGSLEEGVSIEGSGRDDQE